MWRAYVDESESNQRLDPNTYLLAAAILHDDHAADARHLVSALRPSGHTKLHWHGESHQSRKAITATIAQIPALHVVVVRAGRTGESSERRRRKCFERLAYEFDVRDVAHIIAEARERKTNARELTYFNQLRSSGIAKTSMRLDHVPGPLEPLLWIPDAVAGAVTAARSGQPQYFDDLAGLIELVYCGES